MELKTLWLGLLVSLLAFSVKTGLGWSYLWLRTPGRQRRGVTLGLALGYLLLFLGTYALVTKINILAHYEFLAPLWQGGITLHWLVALFLLLWGLILLRSEQASPASASAEASLSSSPASSSASCPVCRDSDKSSKAWLALVIPCPVCLSVILMSLAGLVMYFPNDALLATALLYLAFLGLAGGAGLLMILGKGDETEPLERTLGLVMILIAAYFVISALVMPQFSQVSRIYRLATYSQESDVKFGLPQYLTLGILAVLLVTGFFLGRREVKNNLSRGV